MGSQKNPLSDSSFEHPKHILKIMGKEIFHFYVENFCLSKPEVDSNGSVDRALD